MDRLRVYWISNPPRKPICFHVMSPVEGAALLRSLARYDLYLGDLIDSNIGGMEQFNEESKEWEEWYNKDGEDVHEAYPQYARDCDTTFDDGRCE